MGRGMLVFKGEDPKKKKKKSKHKKEREEKETNNNDAESPQPAAAVAPPSAQSSSSAAASALPTPKVEKGTGQITTSGTVVSGIDTKFEKEIAAGDALIAVINGQQEMRVVTMRLSNVSLNLSSAFSESLREPTSFSVIRKPRDEAKQRRIAAERRKLEQTQEEEKSAGTFGSTKELVYRERTEHGSYRIKREKIEGVSRQDLLDMRSKKTSDKYC